MLVVESGSRYCGMTCAICHAHLKPGDHILASFRHGEPRAIHAGTCRAPRPGSKPPA